MSDAPQSSTIPEAERKQADQLMMIGMIVAAVYAVLAVIAAGGAGFLMLLIYGAIAAALWFMGVTRLRVGDIGAAKTIALITGIIFAVLGLIGLTSGGFGAFLGLVGIATGGALVYAAMLLSPGRKLI